MITPTPTTLSIDTFKKIQDQAAIDFLLSENSAKFKTTINQPTGDFFYDPWEIKQEFKNTIYEEALASLNTDIGEARFIILKPGSCYHSHADIDDRFHLNIQGHYSYLINLDTQQMNLTYPDGVWYNMNAGPRHVAANFGSIDRIQLVVRQLLKKNYLTNPINVNLFPDVNLPKARFVFDDTISPWLNEANKRGIISNFSTDLQQIWFDIEKDAVNELTQRIPAGINISSSPRYNAK
jgi:hypothetical protein